MSKYMQLTVRIRPYYRKGFKKAYPKLAHRFSYLDEAWVEGNPSFFEIAGKLDKLLYQLEGDPPFREILLKHRSALHKLYEDVEERIADWHLAEADRVLYEMEDIFDEIEAEVGRI
ncbi:MAG: hypothetical protein BA872_05300 [Desulfobacterales bacterium C00003060]|nr:MAG: hypothetical protein BA861_00750 [Desulfobacterales bacterium S3730MH5]OEU81402.1 MAG: hypothetical protein BA872_05300 [Desulfobacterales bacterium C00003060]